MFEKGASMKATFGAANVFDFSLGNPDIPPPPQFDEALRKYALDTSPGMHDYAPEGGLPEAREAIAYRMSAEQQTDIPPENVIMTWGAAGGLNVVFKAILNPGDEVLLLSPYFVDYHNYVENQGGVGVLVNTDEEFNLDLQAIEAAITPRTKALLINSPNNPTGQIYSADSLAALGDLLTRAGNRFGNTIHLIADEPYRKIVFDGHEVPSVFAAYKNSIVVTSYSKDLSLPGERIGYLAVHPEIADKTDLIDAIVLGNTMFGFRNPPALMQRVVADLRDASIDSTIYARRKELICTALSEAGFDFIPPKGAFYVFPKTPLADDLRFIDVLLEEKILTVPGSGFGAPGYMRVAFCVPGEVIERSAEGFKRAFAKAGSL